MTIPHESVLCNAKTRQGTVCKRRVTPGRNRCHLHGGKSPRGKDHPRYEHGYYTIEEREKRRFLRELIREMKTLI